MFRNCFFSRKKPYLTNPDDYKGPYGEIMDEDGEFTILPRSYSQTMSDFLKAAKDYAPTPKEAGKLLLVILAGSAVGLTLSIGIPTLIGMKLLATSLTLTSMLQTANYILSIPAGQIAYIGGALINIYTSSKMYDWMFKPTGAENAQEMKVLPAIRHF